MVAVLLGFVTDRTQFGFFKNKGQCKEDLLNAKKSNILLLMDTKYIFQDSKNQYSLPRISNTSGKKQKSKEERR